MVGVFDCFALDCGKIWGFAFEEGRGGDVVLRVVGVFPDEKGGCGLDYVFATEEDANKAGCWKSLDRAIFCELYCKVGEARLWLVMWRLWHV